MTHEIWFITRRNPGFSKPLLYLMILVDHHAMGRDDEMVLSIN